MLPQGCLRLLDRLVVDPAFFPIPLRGQVLHPDHFTELAALSRQFLHHTLDLFNHSLGHPIVFALLELVLELLVRLVPRRNLLHHLFLELVRRFGPRLLALGILLLLGHRTGIFWLRNLLRGPPRLLSGRACAVRASAISVGVFFLLMLLEVVFCKGDRIMYGNRN